MGPFGEKKERSNERKRTNLKKQKWVWSGNPGGTSVTVTVWRKRGHQTRMNPLTRYPKAPQWLPLRSANNPHVSSQVHTSASGEEVTVKGPFRTGQKDPLPLKR